MSSRPGCTPSEPESTAKSAGSSSRRSGSGSTSRPPSRSTTASPGVEVALAATMEGAQTGEALRGGIDLGGTKIEAIVVDSGQQVLGQAREPTPTAGGPPTVAKAMAEAMESAADWAGVQTSSLVGVGVGSPGDVDEAA